MSAEDDAAQDPDDRAEEHSGANEDRPRDPVETERRLRRDVARYREQARTAQAERDSAVNEIRSRSDERLANAELRFHAVRSGIVDLDVLALIEPGAVRVGEDGTVEGAQNAIDALRAAKPYLFGAPVPNGQAPVGGVPLAQSGPYRRPPLPAEPERVDARTLNREQWQFERARLLGRLR